MRRLALLLVLLVAVLSACAEPPHGIVLWHPYTGGEETALKREAGFKARRWVVERTHSGMNRFRRILIRWEKKVENYFGMLHFVCAWITYRSAGLLG